MAPAVMGFFKAIVIVMCGKCFFGYKKPFFIESITLKRFKCLFIDNLYALYSLIIF